MSFFVDIGSFIMTPLYYLVSVVLVGWHKLFGAWFGESSGVAWALSIIGLTVVIRALLIPLFVKQIKSSRNMQLLQPKVKELQKKYGHDRERLTQETMALYKDTETNPFSSCLPLIVQMPIFLALFRLIDQAAKNGKGHGLLSDEPAKLLRGRELFGGEISSTFINADGHVAVRVIAIVLVLAMTATTFLTQRQLMSKNMPADALTGPYAQQQKLLLYVLPLVFAVGGIAFPIGVLLYWTTSNLWTMGQQFYVIRNNPAPNTEAFTRQGEARRGEGACARACRPPRRPARPWSRTRWSERPAQRQQPKKQTRSQRKRGPGQRPGQPGSPTDQPLDDPRPIRERSR